MRILSIDGGGYLGLASAAFLEEVERHFNARCTDRFQLFCGTSTGAIIALALAAGLSAGEVVAFYERLGRTVFPRRRSALWKYTVGLAKPQYASAPLRDALDKTFGATTLADLSARGKTAMVAAFCVTTGTPRVFKTDHSPNLTAHGKYRLADIALASSAAPTYFPLVELRDPATGVSERFCDGGVFANTPALLGYAEAVYEFKMLPSRVSLLSLSTPRVDHGERAGSRRSMGGLSRGLWYWAKSLVDISTDGTSVVSVGALSRIMDASHAHHHRVMLTNFDELPLDLATPEATNALRVIGATHAAKNGEREALRHFFCD